jgi:hypothetical protein
MKKWRDWLRGSPPANPMDLPMDLPVDLASTAFFDDPSPTYYWLRNNHPVAPVLQGGSVLTSHSDIASALVNPALGNAPSRFSVLNARNRQKICCCGFGQ